MDKKKKAIVIATNMMSFIESLLDERLPFD
jgi:hypothetical protein